MAALQRPPDDILRYYRAGCGVLEEAGRNPLTDEVCRTMDDIARLAGALA